MWLPRDFDVGACIFISVLIWDCGSLNFERSISGRLYLVCVDSFGILLLIVGVCWFWPSAPLATACHLPFFRFASRFGGQMFIENGFCLFLFWFDLYTQAQRQDPWKDQDTILVSQIISVDSFHHVYCKNKALDCIQSFFFWRIS